ncbi:DNA mismatch repair protein Mlh1, partial [Striga asiatica]
WLHVNTASLSHSGPRPTRLLAHHKSQWHVRRVQAPYQSPIHALKKWVLLDLGCLTSIRQPVLRLLNEQPPNKIPGSKTDGGSCRELQRLPDHIEKGPYVLGKTHSIRRESFSNNTLSFEQVVTRTRLVKAHNIFICNIAGRVEY